MTQQLSRPPRHGPAISGWGIWFFLLTVCSLFAIFIALLVGYLPQVVRFVQSSRSSALPGKVERGPLSRSVVYEQTDQLWIISAWDGTPQKLSTPGYMYSRAVPPVFTPSGQLVYSGDGVWLTNPFSGHPKRIARLPTGQVITSLALSWDGSQLAWSSAPASGKGTINLYAGPLEATVLVHQQPANLCPCFRVFSFWHNPASLGDKALLLTEDHGDHETVQHGLWLFNLNERVAAQPRQLLASDPPQGPLVLAPDDRHLLYASWEGYTPAPGDNSLPDDAQVLSYANDLNLAAIDTQVPALAPSQVIVHGQPLLQPDAMTYAIYHWIITPRFSPGGHTLAYLEFTNNASAAFSRFSNIYTISIEDAGTQVALGSPQRVAIGYAGYSELGGWLDEHHLMLYANGGLYTLDVQRGTLTRIVLTKDYARIIGTVARG